MNKPKLRLVVDTNIWISFLIGKSLKSLAPLLYEQSVTILFSEELLSELISVLKRDKFKKYFSNEQIEEFLELIEQVSEMITVTAIIDLCRDKKDNFLLALAQDGKADYLITGDKDLLVLHPFNTTKIVNYQSFKL